MADKRFFDKPIGGAPVYLTTNGRYSSTVFHHIGDSVDAFLLKQNREVNSKVITEVIKDGGDFTLKFKANFGHLIKQYKRVELAKLPTLANEWKLSVGFFYNWFPQLQEIAVEGIDYKGFTLVGSMSDDELSDLKEAIDRVLPILSTHGYKHLCYGQISYQSLGATVVANYQITSDSVRMTRTRKRDMQSLVKTLIHELAHRQWYKFRCNQEEVTKLYTTTKKPASSGISKGTIVRYKDTATVADMRFRGGEGMVQKVSTKKVRVKLFAGKYQDFPANVDGVVFIGGKNSPDIAGKRFTFRVYDGEMWNGTRWGFSFECEDKTVQRTGMEVKDLVGMTTLDGKVFDIEACDHEIIDLELSDFYRGFTTLDGKPMLDATKSFRVSEYAMTNASEFFAELFAHGLVNKDMEHVRTFIKSVTQ